MDRFGEHWHNHDQKIFAAWEQSVTDDDIVLVVGDTSWAIHLRDALPDLERIGRMPGRKLLVKGNHDYWWESRSKMSRTIHSSITILNANSLIIDRIAIVGTRGWVCPNEILHFEPDDLKIYQREVGRLRAALDSLRGRSSEFDQLIVALHYPPTGSTHESTGFTDLIDQHGAAVCVYGHLHGDDIKSALTGLRGKTHYHLVSADAANFAPVPIPVPRNVPRNQDTTE